MIGKKAETFELVFDEDWDAARRVYIRPTKEEIENYIMGITVETIEPQQLKVEIKKCPIAVQQYISALERSLERKNALINKIKKLRDEK